MKENGVSLVEMIAVLLIMGIVSAMVISRFASVDDMELAAKVNSIRNHIRYAQVMAMKRNDATWGMKCDGSAYWVFKTATPATAGEPDDTDNIIYLPGNKDKKITISGMSALTLYFDKFGIPYEYDTGIGNIAPLTTPKTVTIGSRSLTITDETGFVE